MKYAKTVYDYFKKHQDRIAELELLRSIIKEFPFEETLKWGMPTYTLDRKNILGIGSFKNWSCLWFHQGGLLSDPDKILVNAQEGKTKALRQWRFENLEAINVEQVKNYIAESITHHQNGNTVDLSIRKKKSLKPIPEFLLTHFNKNVEHKTLFDLYSIAQRNAFIEYIEEAKRESTKKARLQKMIPLWEQRKKLASLWGA